MQRIAENKAMRAFTIDNAIQQFDQLLDCAEKEPVVICDGEKTLAAFVPVLEFEQWQQRKGADG